MTKCARCCLRNSIRVVNLMMLVLGAGIIVYSLWLEKKWDHGIAKFPHRFIFVFLGVGIVVCLSTVGGHIIAHCISSSTLFLYIVAVCSLLFLEATLLVAIFFKMDWGKFLVNSHYLEARKDRCGCHSPIKPNIWLVPIYMILIIICLFMNLISTKISAYTGEENTYFEMVILINVKISRAITILILVAQSSVVILAAILLAAGAEPRTHFLEVDTSIFIQSFLVPTESPGFAEISGQACRRCGTSLSLGGGTARRSFLSRIKSLLGRRFQRANTVY